MAEGELPCVPVGANLECMRDGLPGKVRCGLSLDLDRRNELVLGGCGVEWWVVGLGLLGVQVRLSVVRGNVYQEVVMRSASGRARDIERWENCSGGNK